MTANAAMSARNARTPNASTRNTSLDVLRGAAVALMILVNNPGTWTA